MARTHKNLYDQVCSFDNLLLAARKAQKGKRLRLDVARFNLDLESELLALQRELRERSYEPGRPRLFTVHESKKREICAMPYRDRVVHHALCNVIEPIFERGFIHDSYANRKGKGTHKALLRLNRFCRSARYALKCDIVKYFESVDRELLLMALARRIADPGVLWLAARILGLRPAPPQDQGIPIGNLTSQLFANIYLDGLDHFVKEGLRCGRYLRYVDDFVLLHDDKRFLHEARAALERHLAGLGLKLHPGKTQVFPVTQGIDWLGFKVFPAHRLLRKSNYFHFRRRLGRMRRQYVRGRLSVAGALRRVRSWIAHASWGDTGGLRRKAFAEALL